MFMISFFELLIGEELFIRLFDRAFDLCLLRVRFCSDCTLPQLFNLRVVFSHRTKNLFVLLDYLRPLIAVEL